MADIDTSELSQDRTLPEAVFKRTAPGTPPEHVAAVNRVTSQQAADHPVEVADRFTVSTEDVPNLDVLRATIEKKIGDTSAGTLIRTPEQQNRLNEANAAAELAFLVVDKGYNQLTTGQKLQIQERVLPAMMRLWPELNTAFGTMNRRERLKAMEDILQDPLFHRELQKLITEIQNEDTGTVDRSEYEQKKEQYEKERQRLVALNREYAEALAKKVEFDPGHTKARELASIPAVSALDAAINLQNIQLRTLQNESDLLKEKIEIFKRAIHDPRTTPELVRIRAEASDPIYGLDASRLRKAELDTRLIPDKEQEIATLQQSKARRAELEKEREAVCDKERDLLHQRDELDREVARLQREMLSSQAKLGLSELEKASKEQAFVRSLQNSFARAAEAVVRKRAQDAEDARDKLLKNIPIQARTLALRERYIDKNGKLKKDVLMADYKKLIRGNFDDVVVDMLMAQGGMRLAEAAKKMATDDAFAQETRTLAATELLSRYIQGGNKMKPEELRRLMNSEVGIDVVSKALDANKEAQKTLDDLTKRMSPEDKEDVKKEGWKAVLKKIKLPKVTAHQLLTATAIGGGFLVGGFFAGPIILNWLIPQIYKAIDRWVGLSKKYPAFEPIIDTASNL